VLRGDILVIGGGPAGMSAAIQAAEQGARVVLADNGKVLGGQLVKQTHRFFGSEKEYAGTRGIDIAEVLREKINSSTRITVLTDTTILGLYSDGIITYEEKGVYKKMSAEAIIMATGASEKMLLFENNDMPGVYGAGAVQTLMNVHGVAPGKSVLMVGAGNIGLIVSYQLMQAGVKVAAIIDAAPQIGGYLVHASKVRRLGVPIYVKTTVVRAVGEECVEGAVIASVDEKFRPIPGTEQNLEVDTICLAVGLTPTNQLLMPYHLDCEMKYVPSLGGFIPQRDKYLQTSNPRVFVAGDVTCIEEASSAMVEGNIAGLSAVISLGIGRGERVTLREQYVEELVRLRSGAVGTKIRNGLKALAE